MRISDTKELGELLKKEFGGILITDNDTIQITNMNRTTQRDIEKEIIKYYTETSNCTPYSQIPAFENEKGFEAIRLTYKSKPINQIQIIDIRAEANHLS